MVCEVCGAALDVKQGPRGKGRPREGHSECLAVRSALVRLQNEVTLFADGVPDLARRAAIRRLLRSTVMSLANATFNGDGKRG